MFCSNPRPFVGKGQGPRPAVQRDFPLLAPRPCDASGQDICPGSVTHLRAPPVTNHFAVRSAALCLLCTARGCLGVRNTSVACSYALRGRQDVAR